MKCQKVNRILLKTVKKARPHRNPFSDPARLFRISRHHYYAAALKPCVATVRTAPVDFTGFVFVFVPRRCGNSAKFLDVPSSLVCDADHWNNSELCNDWNLR